MRSGDTNQLGAGVLAPSVEAWLRERGASFARVGADGVVEFSRRPLRQALTDAARDLLPPDGKRSAATLAHVIAPLSGLE